jgi:uncharacterized protein
MSVADSPGPIAQYVLKVHGRCDLACDHCYVYEHADQSWRAKPRAISQPTVDAAARRIAEHAAAHRLDEVSVVVHGGEPLLLGPARMRGVLDALVTRIKPVADIDLRVHSNGVLLDEQWCDLFGRYGVRVGISLDGDKAANDRHRRFADGRSSYPHVLRALEILRRVEYRPIYAGILCTVDLANDPDAVYRALLDQAPPRLDLLLPHATWEHPPHRPPGRDSPYADWLLSVYRRWDRDGHPVPIRFFDSLLSAAAGGPSFTEALGTDPVNLLVIDTNGDWEQPDSMKTAFDGAAATGLNVFAHPVDEVARHPAITARQRGIAALCATCRACPVAGICGGGLYAHRYRRADEHGNGFDNPSVYCADLKKLIGAVTVTEGNRPRPAPGLPGPSGTSTAHALPPGALDALAAGPGDVEAIRALAGVRLSQVRMLVAAVAARETGWRDPSLRAAAADGWALLCALDRDHPRELGEIFQHPYAYAWALRCLRPPQGADADLDHAHLAGLALAAAHRAGVAAELAAPVRHGLVHLPTIGAFGAGPGESRTAVVTVPPGDWPSARGELHRARYVTGPPFSRLAVEDLDPFRDCHDWPAADRLPGPAWRSWQRGLVAAGQHLTGTVPGYARVLGAGLRAVVPLRPSGAAGRSATARQAFGAVAVALPATSSELAELLLHEFQHVKLNVLLDLHPLIDPGYRRRISVPWRDDPRPAEGALHGAYAFLALAHLRRAEGDTGRAAYLRYRAWVSDVADTLLAERGLTPVGDRFVAGIADAVNGVLA